MAEYGGGSPVRRLYYGEDAWPEKYRGRLFWAEWGQRVVAAFRFEPAGSTFKVAEKFDFVEHGEVDDFRPLDLALSHDGKTMYIADWSSGSWDNKTEKLGRVYAVTYEGRPVKNPAAGQRLRPDRGPDPAARPSVVQRTVSGPDRLDSHGQSRAAGCHERAGERHDRPRSPGGTWSGCSMRSPAARPRRVIR